MRSTGRKHRSEHKPITPVNPDLPAFPVWPTHMFTDPAALTTTHVCPPTPTETLHTLIPTQVHTPPRFTQCGNTHSSLATHHAHSYTYLCTTCAPLPNASPMGEFQAAEENSLRLLSHASIHSANVFSPAIGYQMCIRCPCAEMEVEMREEECLASAQGHDVA